MKNVQTFHVITVTFKGPTNNTGSRFVLRSDRFKQSVVVSKQYQYNSVLDQAIDYLCDRGFNVVGCGEGKDCDYVITDTFKNLK